MIQEEFDSLFNDAKKYFELLPSFTKSVQSLLERLPEEMPISDSISIEDKDAFISCVESLIELVDSLQGAETFLEDFQRVLVSENFVTNEDEDEDDDEDDALDDVEG